MSGQNLDQALAAADESGLSAQNRSLLRAMAYGVVREHALLLALARHLLDKPLQKQPELEALLLLGIYQLRGMRMPPHAAVSETVNAAALLGSPRATGLVNAVLRRYQRESAALEDALPQDPALRFSHPPWLVEALRRDWPQRWREILSANNAPGPLALRVNRRRSSREAFLEKLKAAGIPAHAVPAAADALVLEEALPVDQIPGFAEGEVSVQDPAAQLSADLLDLEPGLRTLDACAAPGGKTTHLLERHALELMALDSDAQRLKRVTENLSRLGLSATLQMGDATKPESWWDNKPYERILLDAPCSGTGVIRRHPDIKWLRRADDIPRMADLQQRLLDALWPLLAPRGTLLYSVCSVLRAEGAEIVAGFLAGHADAAAVAIDADWGEASGAGRRLAPGGDFDGFFFAKLRKVR